ncbi:MAG: hypothetical protein KDA60_10595 [Planctomycetales bacterium]|nr:hypothetical protein [Planctomycetales bacterium]
MMDALTTRLLTWIGVACRDESASGAATSQVAQHRRVVRRNISRQPGRAADTSWYRTKRLNG